jgi:facilitated trehalose transporter
MSQEESALVNKESKEFIKILQNQTNEVKIDNKNEEVSMNYIDFIPQVFASCLAYLIVVQAGISMSFSSILITQLADGKEIELTKDSASIIASIWSLALPIGAISSGYLMDKFGRRKTALFICFPFTFSWILTSLAQNVMMIYIARVVLGICTGLTTAAVVYVAEISFKKVRSGLLCMNSVWVSFGIFSTYLLNFFGLNWRTIGYVYATMSFLCIFAIYFIPESPHWLLILNKKSEEDHKILQTQKSFQWFYKRKQVSKLM